MKAVTFDIECNQLELNDDLVVHCMATVDMDTMEVIGWPPGGIVDGLKYLSGFDYLIGHNCIGYDLPVLRRVYDWTFDGKVIDTLVLSRLSNPDRIKPWNCGPSVGPHSVEAWGIRLGRKKVVNEDWSVYTDHMMHRCKEDAQIQVQIFNAIKAEMSK